MSTEQLKDDLKTNLATVKELRSDDPLLAQKLLSHLKNTLWPFIEAHVEETSEIDEAVAELADGVDEVLTFESGKVFAAIIAGGMAMASALEANASTDPKVKVAINEWKRLAEQGGQILDEITLPEGYEDSDDEDDEDDEDEDEDENDDAEDDQEGSAQ